MALHRNHVAGMRTVEVEQEFYADLCNYLEADERWAQEVDAGRYGTVLFVCESDGAFKKLVFTPKAAAEPAP